MGSRGISGRSTHPTGLRYRRIDSTRFGEAEGFVATADLRISRTSSSMDLPWSAARSLSFFFVVSSSWRIVIVAMQAMLALVVSSRNRAEHR